MQVQVAKSKQTGRSWAAVENMLLLKGSAQQHVAIPYRPAYNILFNKDNFFSFAFTLLFQGENISFSQTYQEVVNGVAATSGWLVTAGSGQLYFHILHQYSSTPELTTGYHNSWLVNYNFQSGRLYHLVISNNSTTAFMQINGNLFTAVFSSNAGTTSPAKVTPAQVPILLNYAPLNPGAAFYRNFGIGYLAFFSRAITANEASLLYMQLGIIPKALHQSCIGYWTLNHRYGLIAQDSVEIFNYSKLNTSTFHPGTALDYSKWYQGSGWSATTNGIKFNGNNAAGYTLRQYYSYQNGLTNPQAHIGRTVADLYINFRLTFTISEAFDGKGLKILATHGSIPASPVYKELGTYIFEGVAIKNTAVNGVGIAFSVNYDGAGPGGAALPDTTYTGTIKDITLQTWTTVTASHGQLINYTATEVGLPDIATNMAWVDFYTKQPINRYQNGLEIKTGFPEPLNAIRTIQVTNALRSLRSSNFTAPGVSKGVTFFYRGGASKANGNRAIWENNASGWSIRFTNPTTIYIGWGTNSNQKAEITFTALPVNTFLFAIEATGRLSYVVNGSRGVLFSGSGGPFAPPAAFGTYHALGLNAGQNLASDFYFATFGFWNRALSLAELVDIANNGLIKNPAQKIDLLNYYLFNGLTNGKIKDLVGVADLSLLNYTSSEKDPASPDYVFKPIKDLT